MKELKEFIAWLEKYLSEGHEVLCTSAVIHNLKKILSSLESDKEKRND